MRGAADGAEAEEEGRAGLGCLQVALKNRKGNSFYVCVHVCTYVCMHTRVYTHHHRLEDPLQMS